MVEKILNRLFRRRVIINCDHDPYLTRWLIYRGKNLGIFIHRFHRSDEDRALHDHPWSFLSVILWRGYYEITHEERCPECNGYSEQQWCDYCRQTGFVRKRRRKWPGMILWRPATWRHRVELLRQVRPTRIETEDFILENIGYNAPAPELPAWSLIIRFRKQREWGFWLNQKFVHNEAWWTENCE